jgi:frataxin
MNTDSGNKHTNPYFCSHSSRNSSIILSPSAALSIGLRLNRSCETIFNHGLTRDAWHHNVVRWFQSEAEYHSVADRTLHTIQDAVEVIIEEKMDTPIENDISYAAGVLTISFPSIGTWVLNKQTPNQQIWWSSPISGPKRFQYVPQYQSWYLTKDVMDDGTLKLPNSMSIYDWIIKELQQVHPHFSNTSFD